MISIQTLGLAVVLTIAAADPGSVQRDLAAVKADLALGLAPTVARLAIPVAIMRAA